MTEPCPVKQLVRNIPAEWRGRFVPFSLIAAKLNLSEDAFRAALFYGEHQLGLYFIDARDSPKTKTHVASGSFIAPPRPQGVHDLGDRVAEKNLSTAAVHEPRQSRSAKKQVVQPRGAFTSPPPPSRTLEAPVSAQSSRGSDKPWKKSKGSKSAEHGAEEASMSRLKRAEEALSSLRSRGSIQESLGGNRGSIQEPRKHSGLSWRQPRKHPGLS
jgi:hypothetical protein